MHLQQITITEGPLAESVRVRANTELASPAKMMSPKRQAALRKHSLQPPDSEQQYSCRICLETC